VAMGSFLQGIEDADQKVSAVGNKSFGVTSGSAFNPTGLEESYIYEKRSATRIFDDHQAIAVANIGGGESPGFAINDNLYGFSIFQYKSGFGTGWNVANAESLLGFDLTGALTGGDQLANTGSYFFNLHPSAMTLSEPFATHIIPTQGSGIYTESQGIVLRTLTISGTTGYRPAMGRVRTNEKNNVIQHTTHEPTGYLNFLKLRNVFRNYSDLKKNPRQTHKFYMIWYNGKEQEAWFFEPTAFALNRDSSSPFTYRYEINGTLTQKVFFSSIVSKVTGGFSGLHFYLDSMRKAQSILTGGVLGGLLSHKDLGDAGNLDTWVSLINQSHGLYEDTVNQLHNWVGGLDALVAIPSLVITGAASAANSFLRTSKKVEDELANISAAIHPGDLYDAAVDLWSEKISFFEDFQKKVLRDSLEALKILSTSEGVPKSAVSAANANKKSSTTPSSFSGDTSSSGQLPEDVSWELAHIPDDKNLEFYSFLDISGIPRSLGPAVINYNDLVYPYIASHPTKRQSLSGIKSPGDFLYLPKEAKPIPTNLYTLLPYSLKPGANVYEETLGRDIKLNKISSGLGTPTFSFAISPTGDLDVIKGKQNMKQAIELKLHTTRGDLPLHPGYGFVPVIGTKGTRNLNFNLYLSLNDTMLSDGRIEDLSNVKIQIKGDQTNVSFRANIIGSIPYVPVTFNTKG